MEKSTLRGNISRMLAREELMQSDVFGEDIKKLSQLSWKENQIQLQWIW
jgi:glutamate synthase domain-containing protein 1